MTVYRAEIDRALARRTLSIGRPNVRGGRCALSDCRLPVLPGRGRHLYIDGRDCGVVCCNDEWYILETARTGKEEIDV